MPQRADNSGRRWPAFDRSGRVVYVGAVTVVAWGVLAFGCSYPWAYTILAFGAATVGIAGLVISRATRLLRDQGRCGAALALLRPVYDRFTEGFETADLKAAKALLDALA